MRILKPLLWPFSRVWELALRLAFACLRRRCGSFWIIDLEVGDDGHSEFGEQIEQALQFIEDHDPRRARWMRAHVDTWVNCGMMDAGGAHLAGTRVCYVNYADYRAHIVGDGPLSPRAQEVLTLELAQILVHEATHARIDRCGIKYDERRRERIEKRCRREEYHFIHKAAADFRDLYGRPVDWEARHGFERARMFYQTYWQTSQLNRVRGVVRKSVAALRETSPTTKPAATWRDQHRCNWEFANAYEPWTEPMLQSRGLYLFHVHDFRSAAVDMRLLMTLDPANDTKRHWLALAYFYQRRLDDALALWLESNDRGNIDVLAWISYVLCALDRDDEALEWLEREPEEDRDEFKFLTTRALILVKLGRYQEALRDYDRAWTVHDCDVDGCDFTVRAMYAWLLHEQGDEARFQTVCDELCALRTWWCACCDPPPRTVDAFVICANDESYQPGVASGRSYVLVSLDELAPAEATSLFERISAELMASRERDGGGCEGSYLRSLTRGNDEYPWREVPDYLTGGRRVYVVDVTLDRVFLPGGVLTGPWVKLWVAESDTGHRAMLAGAFDEQVERGLVLANTAERS